MEDVTVNGRKPALKVRDSEWTEAKIVILSPAPGGP